MDEVEKLIGLLEDNDPGMRGKAAHDLHEISIFKGIDISASIPSLIRSLDDPVESVWYYAASALRHLLILSVADTESWSIPQLIGMFFCNDASLQTQALILLRVKIGTDWNVDAAQPNGAGKMLDEGYASFKIEKHSKGERSMCDSGVFELKNAIAKRKNSLSQDKGVLLSDRPKPPKRGTMYQTARPETRNSKLRTGNR